MLKVPRAAWFRRHGAAVVMMIPHEQSADLRAVYNVACPTGSLLTTFKRCVVRRPAPSPQERHGH
jgi:hypothetical protein